MGRFTIAAYKPKPGRALELMAAVNKHLRILRAEHLVTERPAYIMRAADGTVVEVFEWMSADSIELAHTNPAVQALWAEFGAACDYVPLSSLTEANQLFAEFDTLEV